jgi:excinuclease ABC subunit A
LSPAISIDQKSTSRNPRSTVATVTEIYDYLRLLFARIGIPHCPVCGNEVSRQSAQQIVDSILDMKDISKFLILAPVVVGKKGEFAHIPAEFKKLGFARARVDDIIYNLDEWPELDKKFKHTIEIVVDRLVHDKEQRQRLSESVESALEIADGVIKIYDTEKIANRFLVNSLPVPDHPDISIPELAPRTFSFNSPHGACQTCSVWASQGS